MPLVFHFERRVEFCETDAAGIAHFSAFFPYMEQAEHALLRSLGASVMVLEEGGKRSWPRVAARCEYTGAAHFEEVLDIAVTVARLGRTSITYRFGITRAGAPVATGEITSVYCRFVSGRAPEPLPIPSELAERLAAYVEPSSDQERRDLPK